MLDLILFTPSTYGSLWCGDEIALFIANVNCKDYARCLCIYAELLSGLYQCLCWFTLCAIYRDTLSRNYYSISLLRYSHTIVAFHGFCFVHSSPNEIYRPYTISLLPKDSLVSNKHPSNSYKQTFHYIPILGLICLFIQIQSFLYFTIFVTLFSNFIIKFSIITKLSSLKMWNKQCILHWQTFYWQPISLC